MDWRIPSDYDMTGGCNSAVQGPSPDRTGLLRRAARGPGTVNGLTLVARTTRRRTPPRRAAGKHSATAECPVALNERWLRRGGGVASFKHRLGHRARGGEEERVLLLR